MVRFFFILLALLSTAAHAEGPDLIFRMEYSKSEIYAGEQVIANFMIYSREDLLDIEVVKFPEFRGYWSENMSLRQGPIPLMGGFDGPLKKALVGSYVLTAMVGSTEPQIVPMKIVIKHPSPERAKDFPERMMLSEPMPLVMHPLPPLPPGVDPKGFSGAVGRFTLSPESTVIPFQKDEPVSVRFMLQGEGNFQEINRIELPFPKGIEVLSQKSFSQGAGQYSNKNFEITVNSHSADNFTVASVPFVYFNPGLKQYETINILPLQFQYTPTLPRDKSAEAANLELPGAAKSPSYYRPLAQRPFFVVLNFLFSLVVIGLGVARATRDAKVRRENTIAFRRGIRVEETRALLKSGDFDGFLRQADAIALEIVRERARPPEPMSKSQLLRVLENDGQQQLAGHAREIFTARDAMYSPIATAPASETLARSFDGIVAKP